MLYQELKRLMLAKVRSTPSTNDNAEAIRRLRKQIECKCANGRIAYRSMICQTDMLAKSMKDEAWALTSLLKCKNDAE